MCVKIVFEFAGDNFDVKILSVSAGKTVKTTVISICWTRIKTYCRTFSNAYTITKVGRNI